MSKKIIKRIASLCTCATLMAALPVSMDGCMEEFANGLVAGGAGTWGTTETITNSTASATASGGSASASASTSTQTYTTGGSFFGGGWLGGMPSDDGYSYSE
jgi:hypothetical protein